MTDKQIIIDGVDVSGCEFATKAEMVCDTHCRLYDYEYCIGKDCHYKNWKRKEQECEELKKQLIKCDDNIIVNCEYSKKDLCSFIHRKEEVINGLQEQLEAYKMEAEEGKEINAELKAQLLDQEAETLKAGEIIEILTKENEQLKKQACGLRPELKYIINKTCSKYNINSKYYHEKIVEIINNLDKLKQTLTEIKEIACRLPIGVTREQILQKISEVENDNR